MTIRTKVTTEITIMYKWGEGTVAAKKANALKKEQKYRITATKKATKDEKGVYYLKREECEIKEEQVNNRFTLGHN